MPLAAILGVVIVTVTYVLTNVSYLAVMSRDQMLAADTVAVVGLTFISDFSLNGQLVDTVTFNPVALNSVILCVYVCVCTIVRRTPSL